MHFLCFRWTRWPLSLPAACALPLLPLPSPLFHLGDAKGLGEWVFARLASSSLWRPWWLQELAFLSEEAPGICYPGEAPFAESPCIPHLVGRGSTTAGYTVSWLHHGSFGFLLFLLLFRLCCGFPLLLTLPHARSPSSLALGGSVFLEWFRFHAFRLSSSSSSLPVVCAFPLLPLPSCLSHLGDADWLGEWVYFPCANSSLWRP